MTSLEVSFSKTVSESDIYLFAGITGDFAPNHVNEAFMSRTPYKRRIAHGALLVGYMSAASTRAVEKGLAAIENATPVSLGYDKIRFLKPVFIGDTIAVTYKVTAVDEARARSEAQIEIHNQDGLLVAVATHVMKWVKSSGQF
jgi:3-hydroxybutyryl-CoA dehydratase